MVAHRHLFFCYESVNLCVVDLCIKIHESYVRLYLFFSFASESSLFCLVVHPLTTLFLIRVRGSIVCDFARGSSMKFFFLLSSAVTDRTGTYWTQPNNEYNRADVDIQTHPCTNLHLHLAKKQNLQTTAPVGLDQRVLVDDDETWRYLQNSVRRGGFRGREGSASAVEG